MEITENNINCPICNKSFSSDKIEAHAAGCEQYTSDNEYENDLYLVENESSPININNTEILECGVCSKYKTTNGIHYEEHVNSCLQKQHEEKSSNGNNFYFLFKSDVNKVILTISYVSRISKQ